MEKEQGGEESGEGAGRGGVEKEQGGEGFTNNVLQQLPTTST